MLNPVALFRSASSRSSSSRFFVNSSSSKDEGYESSSDFSEEPCMYSGGHQSTLDRLYAWEKKLYEEVRVILPHSHPPTFQSLNFLSEMISFEEKHMLNKASFQCRKLQCIQVCGCALRTSKQMLHVYYRISSIVNMPEIV